MFFNRTPDKNLDRIAGIYLGTAVGDALGVPYEFATPPGPSEAPEMLGGGLGNFAPGEWSDDTSMAMAVAAGFTNPSATLEEALNIIADQFVDWLNSPPADIGIQTRSVLRQARDLKFRNGTITGTDLTDIAQRYAEQNEHAAGNGALMRTAPVAAAYLNNREMAATAARAVAYLTHADDLAADSCVLWVEAIRVAATEERIDFSAGLDLIPADRAAAWADRIADAMNPQPGPVPGAEFRPNGFTVTALQAAIAAIHGTSVPDDNPPRHLVDALYNAVRIGDDTDTVAAIAGGLLGARWGASAIPRAWVKQVHGWPGMTGKELLDIKTCWERRLRR
jgi:ADP-ribosyl-[dinitrogen reductase] hydrolase